MKILVKAPPVKEDFIKSFAFFHFLRREFPTDELFVIFDEQVQPLARFLTPLEIKHYLLPQSERSLFRLHRYAANLLEVFNIDLFFDLEGSKESATLGKFFRATKSIGYCRPWLKFLYDDCYPVNSAVEFLGVFLDKSFAIEKVRGGISRPLKELINLPNYLVIVPLHLDDKCYQQIWREFINGFEQQCIVLWRNSEDRLVTDFANSLGKQNDIRVLLDDSLEKLEQFMINAQAIFSDEPWPTLLGSYLAVTSIYLTQENNFPSLRTPNFKSTPAVFEWKTGGQHIIDGHLVKDWVTTLEEQLLL